MCIIDCLSTIVFLLPLHLDYTKVIILILWWRNFQLEYWRTFQLVSTSFLFITIQICSFSLSCDLLKISLIYAAGGENKTFIGSADWMPRNLDNRVEVITPVYDSRIKEDLWKVIDFGLRGNCQGSVVDGSGKNCLWTTDTEESFRSQEELYKYYKSHITND